MSGETPIGFSGIGTGGRVSGGGTSGPGRREGFGVADEAGPEAAGPEEEGPEEEGSAEGEAETVGDDEGSGVGVGAVLVGGGDALVGDWLGSTGSGAAGDEAAVDGVLGVGAVLAGLVVHPASTALHVSATSRGRRRFT